MLDTLFSFPFEYWLVMALLAMGFIGSAKGLKNGLGIPVGAVLLTVLVWYVGDVIYNDYQYHHMKLFPAEVLIDSWWQVIVFVFVFLVASSILHKSINGRYLKFGSKIYLFYRHGVRNSHFQRGLTILFRAGMLVWIALLFVAMFRFKGDFGYYLFPYIGAHPGPWVTASLGGGVDTLLALANYLQLMVGSLFGVVAALSTNARIRRFAFIGVLLIWPYYIFDRTRKFILVVVLPGFCSWIFMRLRGGWLKKGAVVVIAFLFVNAWFGFIIANRSGDSTVTKAFFDSGFDFTAASEEKHQGLNMFEELAWIMLLTSNGSYSPPAGGNYLANLVNPIPRSLWPSKPTIGLDYAIARGQGGAPTGAGVYSTLSEGVVGQGVVNFGSYIGPAFAALLMSLWAVWLARLDLLGDRIGYLPLYGLGLVLTFTMGRDITFLELYPFMFGFGICWWLNRRSVTRRQRWRLNGHLSVGRGVNTAPVRTAANGHQLLQSRPRG